MPTKAAGAAIGSGISGAVVTILIAFFGTPTGHGVSPEIFSAALVTVVSVPISFLSAWLPKMESQS